jgi:hypothetical protein
MLKGGNRRSIEKYHVLAWSIESQQEEQIPFQNLRDEKLVSDAFAAIFTQFSGKFRLIEEPANLQASPLHRMDEHPRVPMDNLRWNPPNSTANDRPTFPERF